MRKQPTKYGDFTYIWFKPKPSINSAGITKDNRGKWVAKYTLAGNMTLCSLGTFDSYETAEAMLDIRGII